MTRQPDFTSLLRSDFDDIHRANAATRSRIFISLEALAARLGVSTRTLRRRASAGMMPPRQRRKHVVGYWQSDIEAWLPSSGFAPSRAQRDDEAK